MNIFSVHRFLIGAAIVLCLGFGVWELKVAVERGGASAYLLGAIFSGVGIGLILYLRSFGRILASHEERAEER